MCVCVCAPHGISPLLILCSERVRPFTLPPPCLHPGPHILFSAQQSVDLVALGVGSCQFSAQNPQNTSQSPYNGPVSLYGEFSLLEPP